MPDIESLFADTSKRPSPTNIEDLLIDLPVRPSQLDGGPAPKDEAEASEDEVAQVDVTEAYSYLFQPNDDDEDAFYIDEGLEFEPETPPEPVVEELQTSDHGPEESTIEDDGDLVEEEPFDMPNEFQDGQVTFQEGMLEYPSVPEEHGPEARIPVEPEVSRTAYVEDFERTTGFLPSNEPTLSMRAFRDALEDDASDGEGWAEDTVSMETVRALVNVFTSAVEGLEMRYKTPVEQTARIDAGDLRSIRALAERAEQAAAEADRAKKDAAAAEARAKKAESEASKAGKQADAASKRAASERDKAEKAREQARDASEKAKDASEKAGSAAGNAKDAADAAASSAQTVKIYEKVNVPDPIEELIEGDVPASDKPVADERAPKVSSGILSKILSLLIAVMAALALVTAILVAFSLITHQPISTLIPPLAEYGL